MNSVQPPRLHGLSCTRRQRVLWGAALLALASAWCGTLPARAEPASDFSPILRERLYVMLRDVRRSIEDKYYDPSLKGLNLEANAALAHQRIEKATQYSDALAAIAQFALDLDDSHTRLWPPRQTVEPDYGWDMGIIGSDCYVLRVRADSDAARQGVKAGDRILSVNGLKPTRATLANIEYLFKTLRVQPGLHVEVMAPDGTARELDLAARLLARKRVLDVTGGSDADITFLINRRDAWRRDNAITYVELSPDVLVVRLPSFILGEADVKRLLGKASGHAALILDLRGNPGGYTRMLMQMLGGLYPRDVVVQTIHKRTSVESSVAPGAGERAYAGRLLVLVDAESASSAEIFARTLQLTDRGTVIGDRTGGWVMVAQSEHLLAGGGEKVISYGLSVTIADVVMPDGGRLEKVGVEPDFVVLPTADDLASGRDPALAQALKFVGHPMSAEAAGALLPAR